MKRVAILLTTLAFTNVYGSDLHGLQKVLLKGGKLERECNYLGLGDETVQSAAPITKFYTSGVDFGPDFCIARCEGGNSIKAAINFELSTSSAPILSVKSYRSVGGKRVFSVSGKTDFEEDYLCMDNKVAAVADMVFKSHNDAETIAKALNYYIRKPNWAFLVYEMVLPPFFISTSKYRHDPNVCMKSFGKFKDDQYVEFELLAGKIKM